MANSALLKSGNDEEIGRNIDFILEETAYTCLNFKNINMVYPMSIVGPVQMAIEKYNLDVRHLAYDISDHAVRNKCLVLDRAKVNNEIITFITEKVANVNFFVIDKQGTFIYRNESTKKIVKEDNAKNLNNEVWENNTKVIKECKQFIFEESDKNKTFLSVKSPLVINGKVEGIIGLAIDITDRKKKEELKSELKRREELYTIAKE
ncbi:MAG: hypothetical protein LBD61_01990, partial [Endomicrobium sp.]|nr:hypothetical protein [Endomicrobium sp.]